MKSNLGHKFDIIGLSQLALIFLKLTKIVDMNWAIVFIPIYFVIGITLIGIIIGVLGEKNKSKKEQKS